MESTQNPKQLMENKSKEKKDKISVLRAVNKELSELQTELEKNMPKDVNRNKSPAALQKRIDKMEFHIATSAYTPAQEREMLKTITIVRKELKKAMADDKTWGKVREIRAKLREKRQKRKEIRKELDALSAELENLYKSIIAQGTKEVAHRKGMQKKRIEHKERTQKRREYAKQKEANRKEIAPYLKEVDGFVSLADIAEVKKKDKKED